MTFCGRNERKTRRELSTLLLGRQEKPQCSTMTSSNEFHSGILFFFSTVLFIRAHANDFLKITKKNAHSKFTRTSRCHCVAREKNTITYNCKLPSLILLHKSQVWVAFVLLILYVKKTT